MKRVSRRKLEKIAWSHQYGYYLVEQGFIQLEHNDKADVQQAMGYTAAMGAMLVDEVLMVVDKVPLLPVWFKHTKLIGDVRSIWLRRR